VIPTSSIKWTGRSDLTAERILAKADGAEPGALAEAVDFLREELASGPVQSNVVKLNAEALGIAWATIRRAKTVLRVKAEREGFGRGGKWCWRLPVDSPRAL
jgi:hypothetical protein